MNVTRLLEHFHLPGDSPETIQQLRKLFVVLAVGGCLPSAENQTLVASEMIEQF